MLLYMPRLHVVKNARKSKAPRKCRKCGASIKAGESYYWFANRMGRMSVRKDYCNKHRPRPSDMTTSDKLSRLYAAQEAISDAQERRDKEHKLIPFDDYKADLAQALNDAASEAREVGEEYRGSKDNMPENLQSSSIADEIEQKADQCEQWAGELEDAATEIENAEQEEANDSTDETGDDPTEDESAYDEIDQKAEEAAGGLEL